MTHIPCTSGSTGGLTVKACAPDLESQGSSPTQCQGIIFFFFLFVAPQCPGVYSALPGGVSQHTSEEM